MKAVITSHNPCCHKSTVVRPLPMRKEAAKRELESSNKAAHWHHGLLRALFQWHKRKQGGRCSEYFLGLLSEYSGVRGADLF